MGPLICYIHNDQKYNDRMKAPVPRDSYIYAITK